jgi:Rrf2 family protein
MIYLGRNFTEKKISLPRIAKEEKISLGYLEKLFSILIKNNLVKSEKGASGGYELAKNPAQISVYDIVSLLEGGIMTFYCLGKNGVIICQSKKNCGASIVLSEVQKAIVKTLKKIKLEDLL